MASIRFANCMELPIGRMASRLAVYLPFPFGLDAMLATGEIPCDTLCQFHAATSCGFHAMLRIDLC